MIPNTILRPGVAAGAVLAASLLAASAAYAHDFQDQPANGHEDMQRMHELHMQGNPDMQRMHELHMQDNPATQRMHELHMHGHDGMDSMKMHGHSR